MDGQMDGRMDGQMDGRMINGWMDRWTGWLDGQTDGVLGLEWLLLSTWGGQGWCKGEEPHRLPQSPIWSRTGQELSCRSGLCSQHEGGGPQAPSTWQSLQPRGHQWSARVIREK